MLLEENNNNFGAEERNYADDERISFSVLRRLDKKFEDIMLAVHQVLGPKLVEMEGRIMKLELAVDKLLACMKSNTEHNADNSRQRCLNLQFADKISSPIWTGDEIKGEGRKHIEVSLVDETGKLVNSGPVSSAEVQIVAFKGDVDGNEGDVGEIGYFPDDIAREIKRKKSILVGDVQLKLNKGIGILANIKFRSSSSHMGGVFKLGARVVDHFDGIVVQDAKTVSFRVKDYRGKYNEKHRPPFLSDEVWRLDNIGRGGSVHERLKNQEFDTVEDFLIQLLKDSDRLKLLAGLPPKKWKATVKHALTCQLDEKVYCSISSEENKGIVFNVVGRVLGLIVESKYVPLDKLSDEAKADANKLEVGAFVHKGGLLPFNDEASLVQQFSQPANASHYSHCSRSQNTIDHEDELSEIGDSHQMSLDTFFQDVPPSSCTIEGTNIIEEDIHSLISCPIEIDQYDDQELFESIWRACENHQTAGITDMFLGSPVVSDYEVKKKLFLLFSVTKWFLNLERMAACEGNDNQKKRRIS